MCDNVNAVVTLAYSVYNYKGIVVVNVMEHLEISFPLLFKAILSV